MSDNSSSNAQILKRLEYIRALCRNVIRQELNKAIKSNKDILRKNTEN